MPCNQTPTQTQPPYPILNPDGVPTSLKAWRQWVGFRLTWDAAKQKFQKRPVSPTTGVPCSLSDPTAWTDWDTAYKGYEASRVAGHPGGNPVHGVGFCFTKYDPFCFVDGDHWYDHEKGQWIALAASVMPALASWTEVSMGGDGVHVIVDVSQSDWAAIGIERAVVRHDMGIEVYTEGRFVAITGQHLPGTPMSIENCDDGLAALIEVTTRGHAGRAGGGNPTTQGVTEPAPGLEESPDLIDLGCSAKVRAFLMEGNAGPWHGDRSSAMLSAAMSLYQCGLTDGQVLGKLWHYCSDIAEEHRPVGDAVDWMWRYCVSPGRHARPPSIEEMFGAPTEVADTHQSASTPAPTGAEVGSTEVVPAQHAQGVDLPGLLAKVEAIPAEHTADPNAIRVARQVLYESRGLDAGSRTAIRRAVCERMVWTKAELKAVEHELGVLAMQGGGDTVNLDQIRERMGDYVYVATHNQFIHTHSGARFRPEGLVGLYTGLCDDPRELLLDPHVMRKVSVTDFDPAQPQIYARDGVEVFNTWRGLNPEIWTDQRVTDPGPWLEHIKLMVPDDAERHHLMCHMAMTLQRPDIKISHAVILSGLQGCGKDTALHIVRQCAGQHCVDVEGSVLTSSFNAYLDGAKVVIYQEACTGSHRDAVAISQKLKPIVAAPPEHIMINSKGICEYPIKNVVSVYMTTNEPDPVLITDEDRRYFIVRSPIDVRLDPAGWERHFDAIWYWLNNGGWQCAGRHLLQYDVSGFNPGARPPSTAAKKAVIEATVRPLDQVLQDAYELGEEGPIKQVNGDPALGRSFTMSHLREWLVVSGPQDPGGAILLDRGVEPQDINAKSLGWSVRRLWPNATTQRQREAGRLVTRYYIQ